MATTMTIAMTKEMNDVDHVDTADLRGTMHIASIIALSREALINFERAAQLDETLHLTHAASN